LYVLSICTCKGVKVKKSKKNMLSLAKRLSIQINQFINKENVVTNNKDK